MCPSCPDVSDTLRESRSAELADLFRALVPAVTAESEAFRANAPVSFEGLTDAEQLLTAYLRASRVGLCLLDSGFRYIAINRTLAGMDGVPIESHLGKTVREVLKDFADLVEPFLQELLVDGQPILNVEVTSPGTSSCEPGNWIAHYIPIKDATNNVIQIGVVAVEVTEQKKLEESLRSVSETLWEEKKRQRVMTEVGHILSAKLNVQQAFPKISAHLRRVLRQEYAALAVHDEKSGQLVRRAMDFPLRMGPAVDAEIDATIDPRGKAVLERASFIFSKNQLREFPARTTRHLLAEGLQSLCCAPLLRPQGPLGVLVLGSTRADAFKIDDLTLVNQVAAQLAMRWRTRKQRVRLSSLEANGCRKSVTW